MPGGTSGDMYGDVLYFKFSFQSTLENCPQKAPYFRIRRAFDATCNDRSSLLKAAQCLMTKEANFLWFMATATFFPPGLHARNFAKE